MSHGELCTVSVALDDGAHEIRGVIVEVSRVPRSRRRRIVRRFDGCSYGVMRAADYILAFGVEPWEGSTRRATRTETVH